MRTIEHLPQSYLGIDALELSRKIAARKDQLGRRLCILGHHYQRDEIIEQADIVGDSLGLSQQAAQQEEAQYIVFCGVHFMAESAALLTSPGQSVILPNLQAGCPMASMADAADVRAAMEEIGRLTDDKVVPITYVNSTASAKAVTGALDGACCTSGNALNVFRWALDAAGGGAKKLLMLPDEHLGRNTAIAMGYDQDACAMYDPALPDGGLTAEAVDRATFLLWKGHCYVHQQFTVEHVAEARKRHERVLVMVHPECCREVVARADLTGSTEQIIQAVSAARPASVWAIGTENHLVDRLAKKHLDQTIESLSPRRPVCTQMQQIDLPHLLWVLDRLTEGRPANTVTVAEELASDARRAIKRMLELAPASLSTGND